MTTLSDLKAGDVVIIDGSFDCMEEGRRTVIESSDGELFVPCSHGEHFLDGQVDETGHLVGVKALRPH